VNYLLAYWQQPIVVFRANERLRFFEAHRSKADMRSFMRKLMGVNARAER
jgi:hypothetical protein